MQARYRASGSNRPAACCSSTRSGRLAAVLPGALLGGGNGESGGPARSRSGSPERLLVDSDGSFDRGGVVAEGPHLLPEGLHPAGRDMAISRWASREAARTEAPLQPAAQAFALGCRGPLLLDPPAEIDPPWSRGRGRRRPGSLGRHLDGVRPGDSTRPQRPPVGAGRGFPSPDRPAGRVAVAAVRASRPSASLARARAVLTHQGREGPSPGPGQ